MGGMDTEAEGEMALEEEEVEMGLVAAVGGEMKVEVEGGREVVLHPFTLSNSRNTFTAVFMHEDIFKICSCVQI